MSDIVAPLPIAAGGADGEQAIFIDQGDSNTVDLEFDDVGDGLIAEQFVDAVWMLTKAAPAKPSSQLSASWISSLSNPAAESLRVNCAWSGQASEWDPKVVP